MQISYSEFFQLRQENNSAAFYEDRGSYYYLESRLLDGTRIDTEITKSSSDGTEFNSRYKALCNKTIRPDTLNLVTHDYCNNASWVTTDSTFAWVPSAGKVIELQEVSTSCWKDLNISTNNIVMIIWESLTVECPTYNYTSLTPYNSDASWFQVYPPAHYAGQEVKVYVKFDGSGTPLYKATEFTYDSVRKLMQKARRTTHYEVSTGVFETVCWFPYREQKVFVSLRDSKNERIECFLSNGTELSNGSSGIPALATAVFHSYAEW